MNQTEVKVSKDVKKAHTLPSRLYTTPETLEQEKKDIFYKTWQYVGHTGQLQKHGDFFTVDFFDESILIIRDKGGEIRAFYNVCSHRAGKLEEGTGNKKVLQCPYHAWTFHLDGCLNKAPNFSGVEDFEPEDFCLKPVRLEIQSSFIFINLDSDALPMSEVFGSLFYTLKQFDFSPFVAERVKVDVVKCNWKVTIDNYLECDHCPTIHKGFVNTLNMDNYEISTFENYSYQGVPLRGTDDDKPGELGEGGRYYFVYPNMWISINPGLPNVSINQSIPIDHETTKIIYTTYFLDKEPSKEKDSFYQFLDQVREEDFVICEIVQKGLRSAGYTQGRFSLTENCVHHFHLLMQNALDNHVAYLPIKK